MSAAGPDGTGAGGVPGAGGVRAAGPAFTIAGAARALRAGEVTSAALLSTALARADALDAQLGVYVARFDDAAAQAAARADAELAAGIDRGPLHGIPIGVKDVFATVEGPTTAGSRVLDPAWADGFDAAAVARLRGAGAVIVGKLTTMELALGLTDRDTSFPTPRNPWDPARWPGGSSSGAGAGIAAGLLPAAIGTDSGGSIRMPAAFCGVTGVMPTHGRVPVEGCLPLAPSMDRVGPLARTAEDCGLLLAALAGDDALTRALAEAVARAGGGPGGVGDSLAGAARVPGGVDESLARAGRAPGDASADPARPLAGVRIGAVRTGHFGHVDDDPAARPAFEAALEQLAALGADVVEVELPWHAATLHAHLVTLLAEAHAIHREDLLARADGYASGTRAMLDLGAGYGPDQLAAARRVRDRTQEALDQLLSAVDAIATPTITAGAPRLEDLWRDGVGAHAATIHTPYWDAVTNPVLSLPSGSTAAGLPLALQLAARPFEEALLVRLGTAYQAATDWHDRLPPLAAGFV